MKDRFETLLEELSRVFHLPLHPDHIGACSIRVFPHLIIQLQLDTSLENVFLFSKLVKIPPGKFQEEVLKEALMTNGLADPRAGILGYLEKSSELTLHQLYPLSVLTGENLAGLIGGFLEMAEAWHEAIFHGRTSPPKKDK